MEQTFKKRLCILMVDDDESACFAFGRFIESEGHIFRGVTNLNDAAAALAAENFDILLLDINLPDGNALEWLPRFKEAAPAIAVIIVSGEGDISTALRAGRKGADDFLQKPVEMGDLSASLIKCSEIGSYRKHRQVDMRLNRQTEPFFGRSPVLGEITGHARLAANNDTIVLVQGETGTGKGVLARWMHQNSSRGNDAFVELNCSCLKGDLLRSELFGHAKGAFTSAVKDHEGLIETADRGTLFLDEIGELDGDAQAQLLKAIEEKSFRRIGESRMRRSDFRLICATNRNLQQDSASGKFRIDLYYRISVFPIILPPLRLRREDIPLLAGHLLAEMGHTRDGLPDDVLEKLQMYDWPGNIRELRNMLERAIILAQGGQLSLRHFPGLAGQREDIPNSDAEDLNLKITELRHIRKVVGMFPGDKKKAAHALGLSLSGLYRRLEALSPTAGDD